MDGYGRFVVTPWRGNQELLKLRSDLYGLGEDGVDRREGAVNKVSCGNLEL